MLFAELTQLQIRDVIILIKQVSASYIFHASSALSQMATCGLHLIREWQMHFHSQMSDTDLVQVQAVSSSPQSKSAHLFFVSINTEHSKTVL